MTICLQKASELSKITDEASQAVTPRLDDPAFGFLNLEQDIGDPLKVVVAHGGR